MEISGYAIVEALAESSRSLILRARRSSDGASVILKTSARMRPDSAAIERHYHEHAILTHLADSTHVARVLGMEEHGGCPVLVLEERKEQVLESLLHGPMPLGEALRWGVAIARALADIHDRHIIHKDIKPQNILVGVAKGESDGAGLGRGEDRAVLIDFGLASRLAVEHADTPPPSLIEGTLAYMSPEQTGRMNRGLDYRSDLYSLGVTLYRMLTGELPFVGRDPREWCYAHLAETPMPPHIRRPGIPEVVSAVIMKLLAKGAEERYQSARGLAHDLMRCLACMGAERPSGSWPVFALGEVDRPQGFHIPQVLYGREHETAMLLSAYQEVMRNGDMRVVLLSGLPGIGKSSLVQELHRPIVETRGHFVAAKFDQLGSEVPYATITHAIRSLVREILSEPEDVVQAWRRRIADAVGVNGGVITEVIPEVALIIGEQPPVPVLGPSEAQNRFTMVFRRFLRVLSRSEAPLAIFLDDMQWADSATLALLSSVIGDQEIRYICLVLAYRDSEVDTEHPLARMLQALAQDGIPLAHIALPPLPLDSLAALVGDALHAPRHARDVLGLAALITDKTGGNPFFVIQFLRRLHQDGLMYLDSATGRFSCDLAEVAMRDYTDNVVKHMVALMRLLPAPSLAVLTDASCIGNVFALADLCAAQGLSPGEMSARLWPALTAGLIAPIDGAYKRAASLGQGDVHQVPAISYRFGHDRIQQAAYSLLDPGERALAHLRIGRGMRAGMHMHRGADSDRLFAVASQLNHCLALIQDVAERRALAELNLRAARKAKAATAYAAAAQYFSRGVEWLPAEPWTSDYELALALWVELAECRYLTGAFDAAETLFRQAIFVAQSAREKAEVYILRMRLYQLSGRYEDGFALTGEALALFGIDIPPDADALGRATAEASARADAYIEARDIRSVLEAPRVRDRDIKAVIDIAASAVPFVYSGRPAYFPWMVLLGLNLSLAHGNTESSCVLYGLYSTLLLGEKERPLDAYEFSRLALDLNERFGDKALRGTLLHIHGNHSNAFGQPLATNIAFLDRGFAVCQEVGDFVYAGFIAFQRVWQQIERGDPLRAIMQEAEPYAAFAQRTQNAPVWHTIRLQQQYTACLRGLTQSLTCLSGDGFDEAKTLDALTETGFVTGIAFFHIIQQILAFHSGDHARSLMAAHQAIPVLGAVLAKPIEATHYFYYVLSLCAQYPSLAAAEQIACRREIERVAAKWRVWAESCPENFSGRYLLMLAEIDRIDNKRLRAMQYYEEAARHARAQGFVHYEALANELAGRYCLDRDLVTSADAYLREARRSYERWGADGLAARLEREFPSLRWYRRSRPGETGRQQGAGASTMTASAIPRADLDVAMLLQATRAISAEIDDGGIAHALVSAASDSAGADHGCVIFYDGPGEELAYGADGTAQPLSGYADVCHAVVSFVRRTGERVVLDDASRHDTYRRDPRVAARGVRSLLCMPIASGRERVGLLYLENRLLTRLFTPERIAVLDALILQAAVSLQNAHVYRAMAEMRSMGRDRRAPAPDVSTSLKADVAAVKRALGHLRSELGGLRPQALELLSDAITRVEAKAQGMEALERQGTGEER